MTVLLPFVVNAGFNFALGLLIALFLGPSAFGLYAIAAATVILVNTAGLDWIKLSAVRFYSAQARDTQPGIRATLDLIFAVVALCLCTLPVVAYAVGLDAGLPHALLAAAVLAGVGAGWFEYHGAIARCRFLDRAYARLILVRSVVVLLFMVGGAWATRDPVVVVLGGLAGTILSVLSVRGPLSDGPLAPALFRHDLARDFLRYGLPLVAGNAIYSLIPLINRAWLADAQGLAEAGYFSLASDIGLRLFGTLGATIEIVALRHVLRLGETEGREVALAQVSRNIVIVLAVVLPAAVGLWVVLPAFEALLVPPEFRGRFAAHLAILLPGFAALAIFLAALFPVFLLDKRTGTTSLAALVGLAVNLILVFALQSTLGRFAAPLAQSAAFLAVLLLTAVIVLRALPQWPSLKDVAVVAAATGSMAALLWPLRGRFPAPVELLVQGVLGMLIYGGIVLACDVAGWRTLVLSRLRERRAA